MVFCHYHPISAFGTRAAPTFTHKGYGSFGHFRTQAAPRWPHQTLGCVRAADVRVSTLPTLWGEKAVLRLLDHQNTGLELNALGMDSAQQVQFTDALGLPQGLILITGPTGGGKTLTLYSGLQQLDCAQRNISTVEDPVEIRLQGANQIAVNTKIGLGFA